MNADPTKNNHTLTSSNTISTKVEMEPSDVTDTVGKMLIAGFEGCELKPGSQAEKLIRQYRVHSFILGTKNFRNVLQMRQLIQSLQNLAESEHYEYPLLLAVDQELGCCNSMYDDKFLTQFPGSMGLGATGNMDLIYKVGRAAGTELRSIGFNLYMGPVLDVVSSMANQLIGIRSFGFTAEDVTKCAEAFARGLKSSGMTICAKHFPGLGSSYVDNVLELPMMLDTMAQLKARHIIPFKKLIADGLVDAIHASGVAVPNIAPNEIHACLSPKIIKDLLRDECHFDGLAISECLELEALCKNIGLGQGVAVSILYAGCDIVMICNDFSYQIEALSALHQAYVSGNHKRSFSEAIRRINHVLSKLTWPIPHLLSRKMMSIHHTLSVQAYQKSITLVRDDQEAIPISRYFVPEEENNVLVLTPLLTEIDHAKDHKFDGVKGSGTKLFPEETVFRSFGESLANYDSRLNYTVLHTSYTANGLTSAHEALIDSSKVIILFCAEASRNMFQIGVAKYISLLCGGYRKLDGFLKKPLIIVAVTSSYDFLYHRGIAPTYLCTFDYTESALSNIPAVLFGDLNPGGKLPGCNDAVQRNGEGIPSSSLMEAGNSKNMSLRMILNQDVLPDSLSEREINNSEDKVMLSQLTPVYPLETTKVTNEEEPQKQQTFPSKPWLVENFDISRDFRSLILLLKNSGASDLQNTVDKVFIERLKKFLDETRAYSHHFVVRNSTLNLLLGVIFTWVDRNSSNGRILYVIVDKTKRRQSIASVLHQHAITNLKMEMGCKNIILGSDFPLFNFFKPNICEELYQNWGEIGIRHQISSCALQILQFTKSMKWWNSINKPIRRYILSVRMDTWRLIDNLIKQMKLLGIKLCIAENLSDIILLVQGSNMEEANQFSNLSELYMMAFKCIEDEERRRTKNTFVLKLVASSSQKPIGSIILYDAKSKLVNWLPFLSYVPSNSCGVTFLTGSFVDSDYGDLRPMLKMGLICTAVSFAKQLKSEMVMLDGCQCNEIVKLQQCGFQVFREYLSMLSLKKSSEFNINNC